jgi:hypothetical protein
MNAPPRSTVSLWPAVGAAAAIASVLLAIIGGVGSIILGNLDAQINDLKLANIDLNLRMAPLLTLYAQHTSDKEQAASMVIQIDRKVNADLFVAYAESATARNAEIVQQIRRLEDTIVTRAETEVHWARDNALELRVNDLSKTCK